jgi:protein TonB
LRYDALERQICVHEKPEGYFIRLHREHKLFVGGTMITGKKSSVLSRGGPLAAVIGIHLLIGYVLLTQMGILKLPTVSQPLQTVFIQDQASQPEEKQPDIKPEVDTPAPPEMDQAMPQVEVADIPQDTQAPPSDSAIAASASGAPQELKATQRVEPVYPPTSRRMGEEGVVRLKVLVDERGRPHDVVVLNSSGFPRLDQAAVEAVHRWRFEPASDGTHTLSAWSAVSIRFRLQDAK